MEKISIMGFIGADAEVQTNKSTGNEFVAFNVACSRKKQGSTEYHTTWYKVMTSQLNLLDYLLKGTKVLVHGDLRVDNWTDRDNQPRITLSIISNYLQFAGEPKTQQVQQPVQAPAPNPVPAQRQPTGSVPPPVPVTRPTTSNLPRTPSTQGRDVREQFQAQDGDDDGLPF